MRRRTLSGILVVEYVVLVAASVAALTTMYEDGQPWWIAVPLLLALATQIAFWPKSPYRFHYLAVETILVMGLVALHPFFWALGFSLSATIPSAYPNRFGALWIALLALLVGVILNLSFAIGGSEGLLWTLVLASGYAAFGYVSYSWTRAEEAQYEAQTLLEDLQEAHRRLQAYADRVEELAVADERNRLAREMHDTLGHRLTVAAVQLEGAQRLILDDPERAARMVNTVREQVREALSELRRTVATMRTPLEADLSLPHALNRLVAGFEQATDLVVHTTLPEEMVPLPDTHRLALYRAAQEALTNVQRHAQAREVWLQLASWDGWIELQVSDDGAGIPAGAVAARGGFGLRGLRERAAQLGGALVLEARPGGGTRLTFRVPLLVEGNDV